MAQLPAQRHARRSSAPLVDFTAPLDATTLIVEVAAGAFAFKNKIKATSIKLLWEKLSEFVVATLKSQKGVLLPNLGNFVVGPVVGESRKKIRPCFTLLEGRYGGVSQERARYVVGGRAPTIQPSYGQLSTQAGIHRGATQRLLAELLQRLGVHILSGRPIRCEFPGLGTMLTNRGGRFEFVFDPLLMEYFELEQYAVLREMDVQTDADQAGKATPRQHHQQRPQSAYHISPHDEAPASVSPLRATSPQPSRPHSARQQLLAARHQPFRGEMLNLFRQCKLADRIQAGTLPRPVLEELLHREARGVLSQVDGTSVLDLLAEHSYGNTRKLVLYTPFLHALEALAPPPPPAPDADHHVQHHLTHSATPTAQPPPAPGSKQQQQQHDHSEASFSGMLPPSNAPPLHASLAQAAANPQQQQEQQPGAGAYPAVQLQQPAQYGVGGGWSAAAGAGAGHRPASAAPSEPADYMHYSQQQLSPRSRAEYDMFNKLHFERLYQMRGPLPKRALTPKVGEEPLNLQEYQAVKHATPSSAVAGTPHVAPRLAPYAGGRAGTGGTPSSAPPHLGLRLAEAAARAASPLPKYLASPPRSFRHTDQVGQILQDPAPPPARPVTQPSPVHDLAHHHQHGAPLAAPTPRTSPPPAPISYYDIEKADGEEKGKLKVELASELQQVWQRQIDERLEFERAVAKAETSGWPYSLTHMPNDKRPVSAISRPPTSPRRIAYGDRA